MIGASLPGRLARAYREMVDALCRARTRPGPAPARLPGADARPLPGSRPLGAGATWASLWLALGLLLAGLAPAQADAPDEGPTLHVFWSLGCPVCLRQKPWIDGLEARFPGLRVVEMELSGSDRYHALFEEMAAERFIRAAFVPTLMLGSRAWIGDTPAQRREIEAAIAAAIGPDAPAETGIAPEPDPARAPSLPLPLVGEIEVASASTFALTAMIAFVDGFNPCSLWVLTLLLGMVVSSGSRRRVAVVGITFLFTTALIYGAFIAGLFSVLGFAFALPWVRWAVALMALGFGLVGIKDYLWPGRGVTFSIPEGSKPGIYQRVRRLRQEDLSSVGLAGLTVAMASGIALVELPCTAGFPVLWTGILADRGIEGAGFMVLLGLYVAIYLGIELVIFAIAVTGMHLGRMGTDHGRVLKLIGGTVMVALAGALALRPELMEDLSGSAALFAVALGLALLVMLAGRFRAT